MSLFGCLFRQASPEENEFVTDLLDSLNNRPHEWEIGCRIIYAVRHKESKVKITFKYGLDVMAPEKVELKSSKNKKALLVAAKTVYDGLSRTDLRSAIAAFSNHTASGKFACDL